MQVMTQSSSYLSDKKSEIKGFKLRGLQQVILEFTKVILTTYKVYLIL